MRGDFRRASTMKVPVLLCHTPRHPTHIPASRVTRVTSAPPTCSRTSQLALRLQQNWLARHPTDTCSNGGVSLDDSLTSLSWLQNLNILKLTSPPQPPAPPSPGVEDHHHPQHHHHQQQQQQSHHPHPKIMRSESAPQHVTQSQQMHGHHPQLPVLQTIKTEARVPFPDSPPLYGPLLGPDNVDYKTNPYVKPPFSYATLICMAMKETRKHKITLASIYSWITDNFMYYRMAEPSWQNSIRHNLSLNKCFEKVPRRKDEPGKGGFWRINPDYSDLIENGTFKKRRNSRDLCPQLPSKRMRRDSDELLLAVNSIKGTREDKLLSNAHYGYPHDSDDDSLTLRGDFNWTAVLNRDIEIGGVRVKTEHIIDSDESSGPLTAMSPPSSDTNSDDLGLDDLFSQTDISMDRPLDCTTRHPLDLTVKGTGIRPPVWWAGNLLHDIKTEPLDGEPSSGLHTPVAPSPRSDVDDVWTNATGLSHSAFDLDNLFDTQSWDLLSGTHI